MLKKMQAMQPASDAGHEIAGHEIAVLLLCKACLNT
jgi:hypothetical protein